jgi:DNA-binding PadR family transcriptional regulator
MPQELELSHLEFHVLLALVPGPLYGYAVKDAIAVESDGVLNPRAGSLYRVVARLMVAGLVRLAPAPSSQRDAHPGLERKYYALTQEGKRVLALSARRLKKTAGLAERRLGVARSDG